jgi:hypothetical protein
VNRPDGAGWLLASAVWLLPAGRRDWGAAMRAELAEIVGDRARWGFAVGCVRVIATRPAVVRRVGYPLLMAGVLTATLWWTSRVAYPPLRWGSVMAVVVLLALAWFGRQRGPLGPVAEGWTARGVRGGGYLLLAAWTVTLMVAMARKDSAEQATYGVPIFTVMLTSYLIGFLTLTAKRSAATGRILTAGLAGGGTAAAVWTAAVFVVPPIPVDVGPAVLLIAVGMVVAALAAGRRGGAERHLLAALCAGTVASILIISLVVVLSDFAPPSLIPDLAPAALTAADDLAQSRIEIQDPYMWILLLGGVIAILQSVAALASRHRGATQTRPDPVAVVR